MACVTPTGVVEGAAIVMPTKWDMHKMQILDTCDIGQLIAPPDRGGSIA